MKCQGHDTQDWELSWSELIAVGSSELDPGPEEKDLSEKTGEVPVGLPDCLLVCTGVNSLVLITVLWNVR